MKIGEKIKFLRELQNLSADELGAKIGKSRATIYRYEKGEIESVPVPILIPLAQALNVTPAELLSDVQPEPEPQTDVQQILHDYGQLNARGKAIAAAVVKSLAINQEYRQ